MSAQATAASVATIAGTKWRIGRMLLPDDPNAVIDRVGDDQIARRVERDARWALELRLLGRARVAETCRVGGGAAAKIAELPGALSAASGHGRDDPASHHADTVILGIGDIKGAVGADRDVDRPR